MKQLIRDSFIVDSVQVIEESVGPDKLMKIRGIFGRADEFNNNDRRYPKAILEREVGKFKPLIDGGMLVGELDHPEYTNVKLSNASHRVTNLSMQGNKILGEAVILNTPSGKVAQKLLEGGVKLGISSRGMGTLRDIPEFPGKKEVNEDFKCITFDLVADPSTRGAYPELCESTLNENSQALIERTKKQQLSEAIFIKLLHDQLEDIREGCSGPDAMRVPKKQKAKRVKLGKGKESEIVTGGKHGKATKPVGHKKFDRKEIEIARDWTEKAVAILREGSMGLRRLMRKKASRGKASMKALNRPLHKGYSNREKRKVVKHAMDKNTVPKNIGTRIERKRASGEDRALKGQSVPPQSVSKQSSNDAMMARKRQAAMAIKKARGGR